MKEALYILGDVVHTLQRERGDVSVFLYSEKTLFRDQLFQQFAISDKAILSLQEGLERWRSTKKLKEEQLQKLDNLLKICLELSEQRKQAVAGVLSASSCISYYSHQLIGYMLQLIVEIALAMEGINPTWVNAYHAFLQWKERIGLERAIGSRGFISNSFDDKEFAERISFLQSEQETFKNNYFSLGSVAQKKLVQDVLEIDRSNKLKNICAELKESNDKTSHVANLKLWFHLISAKIDALHQIEKKLIDTLTSEKSLIKENTLSSKSVSDSIFGNYKKLICSLKLFSGIDIGSINTLLSQGQIREFHKGKLLFLENEPPNRLYIILKGWVKIFKGNVSGKETTLQMLSSGDTVMESVVFFKHSISCKLSSSRRFNSTLYSSFIFEEAN